ncbi:DNA sulfur modification protein DndB [uncultured Thiodictyon sp.]|uniref:DNA sulfur modification protein DndB n=1 Tax=uncultured Thiodictyon sp. TaxID=1846217 RepID=UPI0025CD0342|nr:DNA sulfur modification protein DndB [uncultured Thiodictyon sp.]
MPLTTFIEFHGLQGTQAGRPQYAAVWSLSLLLRMLDESLTRTLADAPTDHRFIKDLSERFAADPRPVFDQPILLGVRGPIEFLPYGLQPPFGAIRMDPTNEIAILDGLHRVAALSRAEIPAKGLAGLSVPVIITPVGSATEIAERRAAITNPVKVDTRKRRALRLKRAIDREIARDSIGFSSFLKRAVDLSTHPRSLRSGRIFTFTGFARACRPLLRDQLAPAAQPAAELLAEWWQYLGDLLPPWRRFAAKLITAPEVRERTVLGNYSILAGLALIGERLLSESPNDWKAHVAPLGYLDWQRDNPQWQASLVAKGNESTRAAFEMMLAACSISETGHGNTPP